MKNNKSSFLFGLAVGLIFFSIFESIEEIIIGAMEVVKSKTSQSILKENKIVQELQSAQEEIDTYAVGFDLSPQEECDYIGDDDFV